MTQLLIAYGLGCATPIIVMIAMATIVSWSSRELERDMDWEKISKGTTAEGKPFASFTLPSSGRGHL